MSTMVRVLEIGDLLNSWGLHHLTEKFTEKKITLNTLDQLDFGIPGHLAVLNRVIDSPGDQIAFLSKLDAHKRAKIDELNGTTPELLSTDLVPTGEEVIIEVTDTDDSLLAATQNDGPPQLPAPNHSAGQLETNGLIGNGPTTPPVENDVTRHLDADLSSKAILIRTYYEKHGELDNKHQNFLTSVIIAGEFGNDPTKELTNGRLISLAKQIVDVFPSEVESVYYVPYASVSVGEELADKLSAHGKLHCKYINLIKEYIKKGLRTSKRQQGRHNIEVPQLLQGTDDDKIQFLEAQRDITATVQNYWDLTYDGRKEELRKGRVRCKKFKRKSHLCYPQSLVNRFPFLRQPNGYELLRSDFAREYPDYIDALNTNWPDFKEKVTRKCNLGDGCSPVETLLHFCDFVIQFIKSKKVTPTWTATSSEIKEGCIVHVQEISALAQQKNRIVTRALQQKIQESPYIAVVGDVRRAPDSYVIIEGLQYGPISTLDALDVCIKSIFALHVEYQEQSRVVWILLQRLLFKLETVWDGKSGVVDTVMRKFDAV